MTTSHDTLDCDAVRDLAPSFVTGALEAAEADAVRDHLAGCGDPHLEILEMGEAAIALLELVEPVEPPAGLKGRLMAAAEADLRKGRHPSRFSAAAPVGAQVNATVAPTPPIPFDRPRAVRRPALAWLAVAAAVVVAVTVGGWNLALRGQLAGAEAYRAGVDAALVLAARPGSMTAVLVTTGGESAGIAVVAGDGTVRLALRGLPPTGGTQVYTAWGIAGDGAPAPLADVTVGADGVAVAGGTSPVAQAGMVVALTLEPTGGAISPTLPIVASGVAGTPSG